MFDKTRIPPQNAQVKQYLTSILDKSGAPADLKAIIDKKIEKIHQTTHDKIVHTVSVSEYLDHLWKQPDLKPADKDVAIKKVVAIQEAKKKQLKKGEQEVAKTPADLDVICSKFKMTPFEEFNYQETIKNIRKKKKLDMESDLFTNHTSDLDILHALNRPARILSRSSCPDVLHYTAGLFDGDETEQVKKMKAEDFVKKIKDEKKAFQQKIKKLEKSVENRELEELERYKKKELEEEEQRQKEKKKRLEAHIRELKARSEVRLKESEKWQEEYKAHLAKKPLFKELETKFKKGFVIPELEERKKKLQEIRDFHKPISKQELIEHEQKVQKVLEDRVQEKKEQLENSRWNYKKPEYESKHHRVFAEELSKARRQKEEEQLEKLKRKEKVLELLQEVKDNHLPRIDPQKELELMSRLEKLKARKDGRSKTADDEDKEEIANPKKLGAEYLKSVKELVKKIKKDNSQIIKPKELESVSKGVDSGLGSERTDKKRGVGSTKS